MLEPKARKCHAPPARQYMRPKHTRLPQVAGLPPDVRARAYVTNVRRQEHDGGVRPTAWPLLDGSHGVPRPHVHEGGGRADAERPEQELFVLRRVDPQQREDGCVRHPSARHEDVGHVHRQLDRHPRPVQGEESMFSVVLSSAMPPPSPSPSLMELFPRHARLHLPLLRT